MASADILIIGSGIGGLFTAIKLAKKNPLLDVVIVSKDATSESNTSYAQGGIAVVTNALEDSFEKHIQDTLMAGDGLCDPSVVEMVITHGPSQLHELMELGVNFDQHPTGDHDLALEAGHCMSRVMHHRDKTGAEIMRVLVAIAERLQNITIYENHFAIDLIIQDHVGSVEARGKKNICLGAYVLQLASREVFAFKAKFTLLATGGFGQVYQCTTNPKVATGDGVAMAYRAKAAIKDIEFVQFHPTALFDTQKNPAFLITEAMRGMGATLKDKDGHRFMEQYDARQELAPRDIVSRAIFHELEKNKNDCVYLDCTHISHEKLKNHFPTIYQRCLTIGIDICVDPIPVIPAAHYACGGVVVDTSGSTTVENLYACGEVSRTGMHGANRLASNSLLEAIVYADFIHTDILKKMDKVHPSHHSIQKLFSEAYINTNEDALVNQCIEDIQFLMTHHIGIIRSNSLLKQAVATLKHINDKIKRMLSQQALSPQLLELRNLLTVAELILHASVEREQNKGTYYNVDL